MECDLSEHFVQSIIKSEKLNHPQISLKIETILQNIATEIKSFGEIIADYPPNKLIISRQKDQQAQHMIAVPVPMSIDTLTLTLLKTINIDATDVRGCTILPDGRMMFSCYKQDILIAIKRDEYNEGAVLSNDGTLIYCAARNGLKTIDLDNETIDSIRSGPLSRSRYSYVTRFNNNINPDNNTVTCSDFQGKTQWKFKEERVLKGPQGISVDKNGNVYVVGDFSNNVVVISHDGKCHRQILSSIEGLINPQALHYDQSSNSLLVANRQGRAFLRGDRESKKIRQLLNVVEKHEKEIADFQAGLENIKQCASDLQTFFSTKEMERDLAKKEHFVQSIIKGEKLNRPQISWKIETILQNIAIDVKSFGEILVDNVPNKFIKAKFTKEGTLTYSAGENGLKTIDLNNEAKGSIRSGPLSESGYSYVTSFDKHILYTNPDNNTVICIDFHGTTQWEFKEENVLKCPQGISVDKYGNVYVVGAKSNTVVVISHDGKRHRQILSSNEGLSFPYALHYDQSTKSLLVANKQDRAF
ncbi:unnamed protein product [Mytilus edulis]|uniref:SMP-30/Gluconolactonase/LRE-like region domain-containing protein n=1 Tax=Mytilus edulis TaxID=6550 RepID=A0A8S3RH77_MYTED|nr:unnamed protein product [Mytilus edulis]